MKIKEIFELIKTDTLANIAKRNDVHLSEKPLRNALKSAGYEFRNSGNKGWYFIGTGDEATILEQSIYKYSKVGKATANVSTNKLKKDSAKEEIIQANEQVAVTKELIERTNVVRKRSSFDIDVDLLKELKIQAVIHDKNVYEMVERALRQYLKELKKNI